MSNKPVIESLKQVLADSYSIYLKTQNYHWNVEGPQFQSLHALFELQYTELATAIDEIAELIRSGGEKAPATFAAYNQTSVIKPGNENSSASEMVKELAADQDLISASLRKALDVAGKAEDDVVVDAITQRLAVHRKNKWMLEASV